MVKRIGVLTAGGDAPGMNAAIRAVARTGMIYGLELYGIHDGYLGMYEGKIEPMNRKSVSEKMSHGGTFLGTARLAEFANPEVRKVAVSKCIEGWQGTSETHHTVIADLFADCSGDSILAELSNADYRIGREAASEFNESIDRKSTRLNSSHL